MAKKTSSKTEVATKSDAVTIDRTKAKSLFVQLGVKTAKSWDDARLLGKIATLDADDDTVDPGKLKGTYRKIRDAIDAGSEIVLTGGEAADTDEDAKPAKAPKGKLQKIEADVKPAKAGKPAKKATAKGPKRPVASANRDEWGSREGTGAFKMNALMAKSKEGLTTKELVKQAGVSEPCVGSHIYKLDKQGIVKRTPDGNQVRYYLEGKNSPQRSAGKKAKAKG